MARFFAFCVLFFGCTRPQVFTHQDKLLKELKFSEERHFKSISQLTFGGTNAEAYWSYDGKWLTFQHKGKGILLKNGRELQCDQIFTIRSDGSDVQQISNGKGRTTCSYFFPENDRILFSSTFAFDENCPPRPDMSRGYVWPVYPTYMFYSTTLTGQDLKLLEPNSPKSYNAEMVTCYNGAVLFTSDRIGDLELYSAKLDKKNTKITNIKRLTYSVGYDGGGVFSPDCMQIAWRASRLKTKSEISDYKELLKNHLVRPTALEIWTANTDGSQKRQVTNLGVASFAPAFTHDGKKIIFSANSHDPKGRQFDLYLINLDGSGLEQITFSKSFDSFPMFSPDGKYLSFSS
ncbi:MAG: PD40 domain-containing protein, partial [Bdellovibrio sp.]|nr:PD40 domain-containing protein [Bdellovibrio sp.]